MALEIAEKRNRDSQTYRDQRALIQVKGNEMGTIRLSSFGGDAVVFEADYDDITQRVTKVRCINKSGYQAQLTLIDSTRTTVAKVEYLKGQTTINNVVGQQVIVSPKGQIAMPYNVKLSYPAP